MKKILLGWTFGDTNGLKEAIQRISKNKVLIVDVKEIVAVDLGNVYVGKDFIPYKISEFYSAFIRYPYDLIPPHTQTYTLRESTEFLKTLALLFREISINPITHGLLSRNRFYALSLAEKSGLITPFSFVIKNDVSDLKENILPKVLITKCLGNCYFSEKLSKKDLKFKKYLSFEEDAGDTAYIYPAHKISDKKELNKHIDDFKLCFLQNFVSGDEYRMYVVGNKIFSYKRVTNKREDKSSNELLKTEVTLSEKNKKGLLKLVKELHLNYLCLDAVFTKKSEKLTIIDINPYGSLPEYGLYPEPSDALASLILRQNK